MEHFSLSLSLFPVSVCFGVNLLVPDCHPHPFHRLCGMCVGISDSTWYIYRTSQLSIQLIDCAPMCCFYSALPLLKYGLISIIFSSLLHTWLFLLLDMNLDLVLMQRFVRYMFRPFILNHKGNGWIYSNHSSNFLSNHLMNLWFIDLNGSDKHVAWLMVFDLISACVLPRHDPAQGSLCSPQS